MKKSMLTLVGCVLAAGSVMAAEVVGNNTAVVIKKDPVVSLNNYQFLIVPVKGFDIAKSGARKPLALAEILPPAAYTQSTIVYKATAPSEIYEINNGIWEKLNDPTAPLPEIFAGDILWLQTAANNARSVVPPTVFCGELATNDVEVTLPEAGGFVAFGNATSNEINFTDINVKEVKKDGTEVVGFQEHDEIYLVQENSYDYLRYSYTKVRGDSTVCWRKPVPNGPATPLVEGDKLPPGAAAYYYRKPSNQ